MLVAIDADPAVIDALRPKYMNYQHPRSRNNKEYKEFRESIKGENWPLLHDDDLLERAKVWVMARIIFQSPTIALRHHYQEPLLDSGDRRVGWWYTELEKFDNALI